MIHTPESRDQSRKHDTACGRRGTRRAAPRAAGMVADAPTAAMLMTRLLEEATPRLATRSPPTSDAPHHGTTMERRRLMERLANRLAVNPLLTRSLVS